MEIILDEKVIKEAMNKNATEAIKSACSSYQVNKQISKNIADNFVGVIMGKAINEATAKIDFAGLGEAMASDITKQITKVVMETVTRACINSVARMRGLSKYDEADKITYKEIEAEFNQCQQRPKD